MSVERQARHANLVQARRPHWTTANATTTNSASHWYRTTCRETVSKENARQGCSWRAPFPPQEQGGRRSKTDRCREQWKCWRVVAPAVPRVMPGRQPTR